MVPPTPPGAAEVFGSRLPLAEAYVGLLADTGISHGLIGPREAPRLWDRHILNSAVITPLFDLGATVADVGSGAGLPGIPLAVARPDLQVTLIEPLLRRTRWLTSVVQDLGLTNVEIHQGRAESLWDTARFGYVTARAVAATAELARLTLPLLEAGGWLHALKGDRAEEELTRDRSQLIDLGSTEVSISRWGKGVVEPETAVLSVRIAVPIDPTQSGGPASRGSKRRKRADMARNDGGSPRS